ncbi:zymogen granule membrane protein 16-like [Poeciliopsis prolifica]|uniref:zymogen granule membrane protein 16-like n=1 Tax=Poeciliopsis prolifica TaxID=188132 RepID=UPI00241461F7|nr:zymogen granule membrane protein 16-like [Poeciliopsis prolifica]
MRRFVVLALLAACVWAEDSHYSFSPSVGSGSGSSYSITGEGRITAIRVWEAWGNHVYGIQLCYGSIWSQIAGYTYNQPVEIKLFEDEKIIQVSGKYAHYIQSMILVTNKGRSLQVGQPSGQSFNMYPTHQDAELRFISGNYHGGLSAFQAHWAVLDQGQDW